MSSGLRDQASRQRFRLYKRHVMSSIQHSDAAAEANSEFHASFHPEGLIVAAGQVMLRTAEITQIEATLIEVDGQRLWGEKALRAACSRIVQVMEELLSADSGSQVDASYR